MGVPNAPSVSAADAETGARPSRRPDGDDGGHGGPRAGASAGPRETRHPDDAEPVLARAKQAGPRQRPARPVRQRHDRNLVANDRLGPVEARRSRLPDPWRTWPRRSPCRSRATSSRRSCSSPRSREGHPGSRCAPGSRRPSRGTRSAAPPRASRVKYPSVIVSDTTVMPSSRLTSSTIALSKRLPPVSITVSGKPAPSGKPASARSRRASSGSCFGRKSAVAPTGDPGRDHRIRDHVIAAGVGEEDHPAPVDRLAEGLAHLGVVERRPCRREAVVLDRERRHLDELRAERLVVGDPRRIDAADRCVVELAVLERLDRTASVQVADQFDLRDRRRSSPVVRCWPSARDRWMSSRSGRSHRSRRRRHLAGAPRDPCRRPAARR